MPELPEMQALAERLTNALSGAELTSLDLHGFSALKTVVPAPSELKGKELAAVGRRAKYLIFDFGTAHLLVHLSQGGRIDVELRPKTTKPKGSVARLRFRDRASLLIKEFGTERKAALWIVAPSEAGPLEGLGPEPDSDTFASFITSGDDKRRLHTMLRDQRTVAGIGRGFADEILHRAGVGPFESLSSLPAPTRERLLASIAKVLDEALDRERQRTGGLPPKLGDRFAIHGRYGNPCPRCGETMQRVSYESYEITYCPACQTGGKVLADRRLSRLLK